MKYDAYSKNITIRVAEFLIRLSIYDFWGNKARGATGSKKVVFLLNKCGKSKISND